MLAYGFELFCQLRAENAFLRRSAVIDEPSLGMAKLYTGVGFFDGLLVLALNE
jgi:hypothetical protein